MSRFGYFVLLIFIIFVSSKKLKSQLGCVVLGGDCDFTTSCCGSSVCKDYRCRSKGTLDNQIEWGIKGGKCDYFHWCDEGLTCQSHRCLDDAMIEEMKEYEKLRREAEIAALKK